MDLAAAVNAEAHSLARAGADVIQLDEPWLRNDPEAARRIAVAAIDRALQGLTVTTAVHLCFGYAALMGDKTGNRYDFLGELSDSAAQQISVEAAQPGLDPGQLSELSPKVVVLGVLDLGDGRAESPKTVAERIRAALAQVPAERLVPAPDCGMKYLPRALAFAKLQALAEGAARVRAELVADRAGGVHAALAPSAAPGVNVRAHNFPLGGEAVSSGVKAVTGACR